MPKFTMKEFDDLMNGIRERHRQPSAPTNLIEQLRQAARKRQPTWHPQPIYPAGEVERYAEQFRGRYPLEYSDLQRRWEALQRLAQEAIKQVKTPEEFELFTGEFGKIETGLSEFAKKLGKRLPKLPQLPRLSK